MTDLRTCLRDPIPDIAVAADLLQTAVAAHLAGDFKTAAQHFEAANMQSVRDWVESLWGKKSPHVQVRKLATSPPTLPKADRIPVRMPTTKEQQQLHDRDGYHCRFCGVPVIRKEIRQRVRMAYPDVQIWGRTNGEQHAAFQAMWAQYDHILPHALGGDNSLENIVVTCAPCNYARMNYTLEEVGLSDPRSRQPVQSRWDGLEQFR